MLIGRYATGTKYAVWNKVMSDDGSIRHMEHSKVITGRYATWNKMMTGRYATGTEYAIWNKVMSDDGSIRHRDHSIVTTGRYATWTIAM